MQIGETQETVTMVSVNRPQKVETEQPKQVEVEAQPETTVLATAGSDPRD